MKKTLSIIIVLCLLCGLVFGGCSAGIDSVDSLLVPPNPYGSNSALQTACRRILGEDIILKTPASGEYNSAITLVDLDSDDLQEAVIFFSGANDSTGVSMAVLRLDNGEWMLVRRFYGSGSDVGSVEFRDLDNDGYSEILVSWTLFENRTSKMLSVYSSDYVNNSFSVEIVGNEPYNLMQTINLFDDGMFEILLVYKDTSAAKQSCSAKLLHKQSDGKMTLVCETALDSGIASFSSIKTDREEPKSPLRIFIDAYKGETQMITEVLRWNSAKVSFDTPLTDVATQTNIITLRNGLESKDINGDGLIEIPVQIYLPGSEKLVEGVGNLSQQSQQLSLIRWSRFFYDGLVPMSYVAENAVGGFSFSFPSEWIDSVTITQTDEGWMFSSWNQEKKEMGDELFMLIYAGEDAKNKLYSSDEYELLATGDEYTYLARITAAGTAFGLTGETLSKYITPIQTQGD